MDEHTDAARSGLEGVVVADTLRSCVGGRLIRPKARYAGPLPEAA